MIIYKATNPTNGKVYIGQTKNSLNQRISSHKYSAANRKSQSYFHKAIRQYGFESFQWEVVCVCASKEELDIKEIEYIKLFDTHVSSGKGYNLTKGGDYNPMSDPDIRNRQTESLRVTMKQFCGDRNVMNRPEVRAKYKKSTDAMRNDPEFNRARQEGNEKQKSTYEITFPDGHIEIVHGLNKFCKEHGLQQSKMSSVGTGNRPHHKGFQCKFIKQGCTSVGKSKLSKTYSFQTPCGDVVTTGSLKTFCKENGLSYECMLYVQQGKQRAHKGYTKA